MLPLIGRGLRARVPSSRVRILSRVGAFDIAWALVTPFLAFLIRDGAIKQPDIIAAYCFVALIASLVTFQWFNISSPLASFFSVNDALVVIKACITTVALSAVVIFTLTRLADAPRSIPLIHFMLLASGLIGERAVARLISSRQSADVSRTRCEELENILIVGATRLAWFFSKMVEELASHERIVAVLDERPWLRNRTLNGCPIVGSPFSLAKVIDEYAMHGIEISKIVVAMRQQDLVGSVWIDIQTAGRMRNIPIEWLPERFALSPPAPSDSLDRHFFDSETTDALTGWSYWGNKRLLDFVLALVAMITIAPLAIVVSAMVLTDVGFPIVFWQQRIGHLGRPLCVYKFRTMRNSFDRDGHPVPDPERLSPLGWLLRKSRLDEIPQLFNILTGSMSFVGPRPLLPVDQPKNVRIRLKIRPGLTGLAQINGGKLLTPEEKDALDEWYVQHVSLWLDLKIILRTIWVILRGDRRNEAEISSAVAERDMNLEMVARPLRS